MNDSGVISNSTQKPIQINFDTEKAVGLGVTLSVAIKTLLYGPTVYNLEGEVFINC